jgi:hypothetical protein
MRTGQLYTYGVTHAHEVKQQQTRCICSHIFAMQGMEARRTESRDRSRGAHSQCAYNLESETAETTVFFQLKATACH